MEYETDTQDQSYTTIDINTIHIDPEHFRTCDIDTASLKSTIADVGLLQPILVRTNGDSYVVIDGGRRLQALKELDVPELILGRDVIVDINETDADFKFKQVIANVQREDLNDIELGKAFVMLKERYGYQYNEIAEIIGKTPHYIAAKVGLAKRLTPEIQTAVLSDWQAAKCIQNTLSDEAAEPFYTMNVNVIEDIARLPADLQQVSYNTIKERQMDKKEALAYLKVVKDHTGTPGQSSVSVAMSSEAYYQINHKALYTCLKKIDRDVEKLSETLKLGVMDTSRAATAIESLIERLSALYADVKGGKVDPMAIVSTL